MSTSAAAPAAAPITGVINYSDMGYVLTTDPDDTLPDMDGFDRLYCGSSENGWTSPCEIRAGRDLAVGETLTACLIRQSDGKLIDEVTFTADSTNCKQHQWPAAFARAFSRASRSITAGNFDNDNNFKTDGTALPVRLWHHSCRNRAFTTAPFSTNQVQALAVTGETLKEGARLCVQVRDISTQALYENHFFNVKKDRLTLEQWGEDLCVALNRDSRLLRAGVKNAQTCTITPMSTANALWVPQDCDLSVTLTCADWINQTTIDGSKTLPPGQCVNVYVMDAFSAREVVPAFSFVAPTPVKGKSETWLSAWSTAVGQSALAPYVRIGNDQTDALAPDAVTATLWQSGDAFRVFSTEPCLDNWLPADVCVADLYHGDETGLVVMVRHPHSHEVVYSARFAPLITGEKGKAQWVLAFCDFIRSRQWPCLRIGSAEGVSATLACKANAVDEIALWVPRDSELTITVEADAWGPDVNIGPNEMLEVTDWVTGDVLASYQNRDRAISDDLALFRITDGVYQAATPMISLGSWSDRVPGMEERVFRLTPQARDLGVKVASSSVQGCRVTSESAYWRVSSGGRSGIELEFDYADSVPPDVSMTLGHVGTAGAFSFWSGREPVVRVTPKAVDPYVASSPLCEDYGNTFRSEVFDVSGQSETGIDPRTGLFHAHYPVATLQGLEGNGPICDLTLHYSALRGNEAGLGDGWAFRFSSLDVRDRALTLANGVHIDFDDAEWLALGQGKRLTKRACWVSSNNDYSEFTLHYPSGTREVLSRPTGDNVEPNDALRLKIIDLLEQIKNKAKPCPPKPEGVWQWILAVSSPVLYAIAAKLDWDEAVKKWRENTKAIDDALGYWRRPFVQLVPSRILSNVGGELSLNWNRQLGQFQLTEVRSGSTVLFTAKYSHAQVSMEVWPGSSEAFQVTLTLSNYLLCDIRCTQSGHVFQSVHCGYSVDPTLDRVLTRLEEEDGSVESVVYEAEAVKFSNAQPALPHVLRHILLPGRRQENIVTTYRYSESTYVTPMKSLNSIKSTSLTWSMLLVETSNFLAVKHEFAPELLMFGQNICFYWVESNSAKDGVRVFTKKFYDYAHQEIGSAIAQDECVEYRYTSYQSIEGAEKNLDMMAFPSFEVTCWKNDQDELLRLAKSLCAHRIWGGILFFFSLCPSSAFIEVKSKLKESEKESSDGLKSFASSMTSVRSFTYNDDGQLTQSIAADETITEWRYYPRSGGAGMSPDMYWGFQTPEDLKKVSLTCPQVPDHTLPPAMAEYQYQVLDGKCSPLALALYGYREQEYAGNKVLSACDIVNIEGVVAAPGTWKMSMAEGRSVPLIRHEKIREEPRKPKSSTNGCKAFIWSSTHCQTTCFDGNFTQLTTTLRWEDNPVEQGFVVCTDATAQSIEGKLEKTLSTEIRSRLTRRCLVRRRAGEELRWAYDALGRVVSEQRFSLPPGENRVKEGAKPVSEQNTAYCVVDQGVQATTLQTPGQNTRTLFDGLQRPIRRELKAPNHAGWCVLDEIEFDNLSCKREHSRFDYWPGGLRRRSELGQRGVLSVGSNRVWNQEETTLQGAGSSTTVQSWRTGQGEVIKQTSKNEVLADGTVRRTQSYRGGDRMVRPEVSVCYDRAGRLTHLQRGDSQKGIAVDYDELGRVTGITQPDGSRVDRQYNGLGSQVTHLSVDGIKVGSQGSFRLKSTKGLRAYSPEPDGGLRQPDGTVLRTELTEGRGLSFTEKRAGASSETPGNLLSALAFTELGKTLSVSTHESVNQQDGFLTGPHSDTLSRPGLLGDTRRVVRTPRGSRKGSETRSLMGNLLAARRSDGSVLRLFLNRDQKIQRQRHNGIDVSFCYTRDGHLLSQTAVIAQEGTRLTTRYQYDVFGQEVLREYQRAGSSLLTLHQRWSDNGLLTGMTLKRGNEWVRTETFSHDSCDRLATYQCDTLAANDCPADAQGRRIRRQVYQWDGLQRLNRCETTFVDKTSQTQRYGYEELEPTQCASITLEGAQPSQKVLTWSKNGCMEQDADGNTMTYSAQGQLLEVKDPQNKLLTRYAYDGYGRLAAQYVAATGQTCELVYEGDHLCGEVWFDRAGKVIKQVMLGTDYLQQTLENGARPRISLSLDDPHSGPIAYNPSVCDALVISAFTPFGENGAPLEGSCKGYNGERRDPVTGCYHLGNGYRAYHPQIRSFQQPDSLSPFDGGGINEYSYCCNPIDYHDPSGHIMLSRWGQNDLIDRLEQTLRETRPQPVGSRWRGIALSFTLTVVGVLLAIPSGGASLAFFAITSALSFTALALEVTSKFLEDSDPEFAHKLGIASMVTGFLSIGNFFNVFKQAGRMLRWTLSGIGRLVNRVQAGIRGAIRGWRHFKRYGSLATAVKDVAAGRKVGSIAWTEMGTQYVEYLGEGAVRTVTGLRAKIAWYVPGAHNVMRRTAHLYHSRVLVNVAEGAEALGTTLEGKIYYDTYAGVESLYLPEAEDDKPEKVRGSMRWAEIFGRELKQSGQGVLDALGNLRPGSLA
ncbi:RHS repeat-associated core domain-containing protein [Pseudomonas alliivorans]|nr:RHS repeat-associated core domain-containing protein [Pseudomonas alliivorans]MEE4960962.1 RHS repeat-associated core domain-containing protein [Pseudomonas alliivorans]MEE4973564.1 RHS repeat-associated core domain-containing protein [Pseudomonas alliivorans]MEE4976289.1 RHS repeat-associated core domain-containing protein [Pseudomonas alliivorans]MEE4981213.1 RHS repeat-associated core domain-containing protein [Pseudomonas alliivorans]